MPEIQLPLEPRIAAQYLLLAHVRAAGGPGSGPHPGEGKKGLKVVCAWCNKPIRVIEGPETDKVSHGICPDCQKKLEAQIDEKYPKTLSRFLNWVYRAFGGPGSGPHKSGKIKKLNEHARVIGVVNHDGSVDTRKFATHDELNEHEHEEVFGRSIKEEQKFRLENSNLVFNEKPSQDDYYHVTDHLLNDGLAIHSVAFSMFGNSKDFKSFDARTLGGPGSGPQLAGGHKVELTEYGGKTHVHVRSTTGTASHYGFVSQKEDGFHAYGADVHISGPHATKDKAIRAILHRSGFKTLGGPGSGPHGHKLPDGPQIVSGKFDINEIQNRLFLFNPKTNQLVLSGEKRPLDYSGSHAVTIDEVGLTPADYDQFTMHGYIRSAETDRVQNRDDGNSTEGQAHIQLTAYNGPMNTPQQSDDFHKFYDKLLANGATHNTMIDLGWRPRPLGGYLKQLSAHTPATARALALYLLGGPGSGPRKGDATPAVHGFGKIRGDLVAQSQWREKQAGLDGAINRYTDYHYKNINASIREGTPNEDAKTLIDALNRVPPVDPPVIVWRGLGGSPGGMGEKISAMKPGASIQLNGLQSTSTNFLAAKNFAKAQSTDFSKSKAGVNIPHERILMKIEATKGLFIGDKSTLKSESEFLMNHGHTYTVKSNVQFPEENLRIITMRQAA